MPSIDFTASEEEVAAVDKPKFGPGNYKFVIMEADVGSSPVKGTPRIELKMLVDYDGMEFKVFDDIYLTTGAKWRFIQFCKGVGFDPTQELDTDDMPGKEGILRMKNEKGSTYMKVGEYYSSDVSEKEPLGPFPQVPVMLPWADENNGVEQPPF